MQTSSGATKLRSGNTAANSNSWADVLWDEGAYLVAANTILFLVLTGANKDMFVAGAQFSLIVMDSL